MGTQWKGKGKRYGGGPFSPKKGRKKGGCFSVLLIVAGSGLLGVAGVLSMFLERVGS